MRTTAYRGIASVGGATAVAALLGWLVLVVVARSQGPQSYAEFSVQWGLFFAATGVLFGIQQEITRSVASAGTDSTVTASPRHTATAVTPGGRPVRLLSQVLGLTALLVLLFIVTSPAWAPQTLGAGWQTTIVVMGAGLVSLAVQSSVTGVVAARSQLRLLAGLLVAAAAMRLAVIGVTCLVDTGPVGLTVGIVSGSTVWLLLLGVPALRSALRASGADDTRTFLRRSASPVVSTLCAAALATGFPFLLRLTSDTAFDAADGVLLAAIVATRTPLLLPLNGYQLVIIGHFVRNRDRPLYLLRSAATWLVPLGVVATGLGAVIGPWTLRILFGPEFVIGRGVIALLVIAGCALVFLTLTGSALLSVGMHGASAAGWMLATGVTCGALLLPLDETARAVTALISGPLLGAVLHCGSLVTRAHADESPRLPERRTRQP